MPADRPTPSPAPVPDKPRARHDQAYKAFFAFLRALSDLLCGFVSELIEGGEEWFARLDFARAERMQTEEIEPPLASRHNDMVWRVPLRDAAEGEEYLYVVVLLEFQSRVDRFMALRVQHAALRLYDSLRKDRPATRADWVVPILPVVVYNGEQRWTAPTRLGDLVRPGTRPDVGERRCPPTFTGDGYTVIDIGAYQGRALPLDNLMSLLIRTELMESLQEAGPILEDAWKQLAAPELREFREHFRGWFRLTLLRLGLDWRTLESDMAVTKLAETGKVRSLLEARIQARDAVLKEQCLEQGREEGLQRERSLLRRLATRRFGAATAARLERYLAAIREPDRLEAVGDWILDCASGPELLERLEAAP